MGRMTGYTWPTGVDDPTPEGIRGAWLATVGALPVGTAVTGKVIGRQPFGVFVQIDGVPDAVGLAEIFAALHGAVPPPVGFAISGNVVSHAITTIKSDYASKTGKMSVCQYRCGPRNALCSVPCRGATGQGRLPQPPGNASPHATRRDGRPRRAGSILPARQIDGHRRPEGVPVDEQTAPLAGRYEKATAYVALQSDGRWLMAVAPGGRDYFGEGGGDPWMDEPTVCLAAGQLTISRRHRTLAEFGQHVLFVSRALARRGIEPAMVTAAPPARGVGQPAGGRSVRRRGRGNAQCLPRAAPRRSVRPAGGRRSDALCAAGAWSPGTEVLAHSPLTGWS